eukprot:scaffold15116_cov65-Cylindrotheca_fusiformis.AAC.3
MASSNVWDTAVCFGISTVFDMCQLWVICSSLGLHNNKHQSSLVRFFSLYAPSYLSVVVQVTKFPSSQMARESKEHVPLITPSEACHSWNSPTEL